MNGRDGSVSLPDLDAFCSCHFKYRAFVECSDTWHRTRIDNTPRQRSTYDAMRDLAEAVLDPIADRFGEPILTYAFASPQLTKRIRANPFPNVTPRTDQHAGCELTTRGTLICSRKGMAVDLRVDGVDSRVIAAWTALNTPFDRLYFYSGSRPFHVSHGPENKRLIVRMVGERGSAHYPGRRLSAEKLNGQSLDELMANPVFA